MHKMCKKTNDNDKGNIVAFSSGASSQKLSLSIGRAASSKIANEKRRPNQIIKIYLWYMSEISCEDSHDQWA